MKNKLTTLALILCVLTTVLVGLTVTANAATVASGTCGDNLTWTLDDGGKLTISGTGAMNDYDYYSFSHSSAPWDNLSTKTVAIDNGVKSIGDYAFFKCTGLTSVTIPDSVTSIGLCAFENCTSLQSITIPNGVTSIDEAAFIGCTGLTSIEIPNSVTSIGRKVFNFCSALTSICISSNNAVYSSQDGALYNLDKTVLIRCPEGKSGMFVIPNSVTDIGEMAFYECSALTSITIPNSVTSIGDGAFCGCAGLTSITIPNSVTSIGSSAFSGCTGLTSVTIHNSVTSIGDGAFGACTALTDVTYIGNETKWKAIAVGWDNKPLKNAKVSYVSLQLASAKNDGKQAVVTVFASNDNAKYLVALYDEQGRMLAVQPVASETVTFTKNGAFVKAFELNDAYIPLCAAAVKPLS